MLNNFLFYPQEQRFRYPESSFEIGVTVYGIFDKVICTKLEFSLISLSDLARSASFFGGWFGFVVTVQHFHFVHWIWLVQHPFQYPIVRRRGWHLGRLKVGPMRKTQVSTG